MKSGKAYWDLKIEETKALFEARPQWMSVYDNDFPSAAFIRGLISDYKPENLFEAGTAAGWAAYYMLEESHKYSKTAKLTSIDNAYSVYYDSARKIGDAFFETAPELAKFWDLNTNIIAADYVQGCDKKFDFAFIDASHLHPWATLDLLAILPCLNENAVIVFHDVFLNKIAKGEMPADRHPAGVVCGKEKYFGPNRVFEAFSDKMVLSYDEIAPNCAAIEFKDLSPDKMLTTLDSPWETEILNYTTCSELRRIFSKLNDCAAIFAGESFAEKFVEISHRRLQEIEKKIEEKISFAADFLNETIKNKKTVLWGASRVLRRMLEKNMLEKSNILGIVDINPSLQGKMFGGLAVYPPKSLKELKPQQICSAVVTTPEMKFKIKNTLQNEGISGDFEILDDLFECFQNFVD